ncbi:MAG: class I SAM-dependent methyltransferase [Nostoc sp. DedVER02]|uniref:class I SAM-dependent methyltransferase n=1 Tax=unclassified Nostoc TaxID=2593658 RepID=UPI002AD55C9E|nr:MULTISPECIES: methyltransferase domain-containing protein [unclassified Nostoc]MDZ7986614.1 methyltransferase domain-containing protein [Nostoc sp. DedVER02]MDZ8116753.1 methyltransferase domain-containing protein [Nostoc sp. DedVER01b]
MSDKSNFQNPLLDEILAHYERGLEAERLLKRTNPIELVRTQELLSRYLPPPPAVIFDVGGGSGIYACWLAQLGYKVHLIDPVPLHVEQARFASQVQPDYPLASAEIGDARQLNQANNSVDAVLLFGPLYHLIERNERIAALREANRVLKSGGLVFAVACSRFASLLDGLFRGWLDDPEFVEIVHRDLLEGQHRNPSNHPAYFTTAFFHHPDQLKAEVEEAGLSCEKLLAIEGPGKLLQNFEEHWSEPSRRERLLQAIRWIETEPSTLGVSAHIIAIAKKVAV